jgi:glycerol-3-phosphate dehydrogenase (NAD(P)+)
MKVTIIGAGELGQAIGQILPGGLYKIAYWDCDEAKLAHLNSGSLSLPEALLGAEFVFLCVPSWRVKEFLAYARPYWPKQTTLVFLSKGVDAQTQKMPFELAGKFLPAGVNWVVLSGAMMAEEIRVGRFGACLVASKTFSTDEKVIELFRGTNILALPSRDIKGVAWSGVLKNIYALGLGMAEGLGWTINERGLLFAESTEEILRLIKILGGKKETFLSSPALADFVSTSFDKNSSNHQAGFELGQKGETAIKSEGLVSLAPLLDRLGTKAHGFSILNNLSQIIIGHADPKKFFGKY